ncbi:MAG: PTS sugar transporter subunit IIA [Epulopiscium sp.]|nr:PTS sugar transporter subunit IIA [Candidatus Epulonipiscium sp.]
MLINKNLIEMNLTSKTRDEVIQALAKLAYQEGRVSDIEKYVQAVLKRENEYSTSVGFGVAIPHGKTNAVKEPFLGFARVKEVDWAAPDKNPIDLVFIIGVPEEQSGNEHLKILAKISRKLMKEDFRSSLRNADTKESILNIIQDAVK